MLVIHIFAQMYPLLQNVTKLYSAKEWQMANTFIPQLDSVFIILGSSSCCSYSWNVFIPQSSHFGRAMEVAVKGKSPSYLHLFPP